MCLVHPAPGSRTTIPLQHPIPLQHLCLPHHSSDIDLCSTPAAPALRLRGRLRGRRSDDTDAWTLGPLYNRLWVYSTVQYMSFQLMRSSSIPTAFIIPSAEPFGCGRDWYSCWGRPRGISCDGEDGGVALFSIEDPVFGDQLGRPWIRCCAGCVDVLRCCACRLVCIGLCCR